MSPETWYLNLCVGDKVRCVNEFGEMDKTIRKLDKKRYIMTDTDGFKWVLCNKPDNNGFFFF